MHHVCHLHRLGHDHGHQILGGGDDDDAIHRNALEHRQGHVAGSGRHIHEQIVHILPDHVGPELLHRARDDRAAPDHRVGGVIQQQVDGHDLDAGTGQGRVEAVFIGTLALGDAEGCGGGGAGDVRVQDAHTLALPGHAYRQQGGDGGLAHAALAGDHRDDLFDSGIGIQFRQKALRLAVSAVGAAAGTVAVARTHFNFSFYFYLNVL